MGKRIWIGIVIGIGFSSMVYAAISGSQSAELLLGDATFPKLQIWNFQDLSHSPRLFVSNTAGSDAMDTPSFFYTFVPRSISGPHSPLTAAIRSEGAGDVAGGILYGETAGTASAFGANPIGATYSGAPAEGLEVNGLNLSGNPQAKVRGMDIVNGGNASTQWALGVETSIAQPAGEPSIGIMLAGHSVGYPAAPARDTGLFIDHIDSGEAIRIQAGDRIALNSDGTVYFLYNPSTNRIEFYRNNVLKFAIPM